MASDAVPDAIGPYRIESELGRGMMGVVYKARDTRSKRPVALKLIRMAFAVSEEQKASFERRFMEEAEITKRLDHPGIVRVYEIGRDPEQNAPFIAFEYLEGQTLAEMLEQGALPWRTALLIVARVAEALEHAHRQGIIHRDIKPANVMVLHNGEPKIMDFGLAKRDAGLELTSTGQFLGTPLYMSPEQALGRKVDARTDIFSLGSVAYTLLTGKRAFDGDSIPQVMNKVTYQTPPPPTRLTRDLPPEADYLIARAMAKSPDARYANAFAFAEDINDVWHGKKPRHRAGWTAPSVGEGTMVSPESPAPAAPAPAPRGKAKGKGKGKAAKSGGTSIDDLPLLELDPLRSASPPPPSGGSGGKSAGWALLLLALVGAGLFWRTEIVDGLVALNRSLIATTPAAAPSPTERRPVAVAAAETPEARSTEPPPSATATTEATTAAPTDEPTVSATAAPTVSEAPARPATTAAATVAPTSAPTAVPRRTPRKTPTPRTPTPKARPRPVAEACRLTFVLEHHYKSGTVRVWVDDDKLVDASLTSEVTQDLKVVKIRKGTYKRTLSVPPGTHRIRVELKSGDDIRAKESTAVFKAGVARRLDANTNRVTGGLSLDWE
jgi:serine/threonine protein kinase